MAQEPTPTATPARLYIVTRADLPPGLQAAQAVHAAFQMAVEHPDVTATWHRDSNFIVIVAVPDEAALTALATTAMARGIATQVVVEPDLNDAVTAIALEPGDAARRLCSPMPLALREKVPM